MFAKIRNKKVRYNFLSIFSKDCLTTEIARRRRRLILDGEFLTKW